MGVGEVGDLEVVGVDVVRHSLGFTPVTRTLAFDDDDDDDGDYNNIIFLERERGGRC